MAEAMDFSNIANITEKELKLIFDHFDADKSGCVDFQELMLSMQMLGLRCTVNSAKKVLLKIDLDGNNKIEFSEFQIFFKAVSSSDEIKCLLSKENQVYFEYKEKALNDASFSKTFKMPPSKKETKKCMGHCDSMEQVAWLSDTKVISAASDGGVFIWDTLSEKPQLMKLSGGPRQVKHQSKFQIDVNKTALYSMKPSRDGRTVLAGLGSVTDNVSLWNTEDGSFLRHFKGFQSAVYGMDFDMDGTQVACGSQRGVICIHDVEHSDQPLLTWKVHESNSYVIHSLAWRTQGLERGTLCSACSDGTVKIFDVRAPAGANVVAEIGDAAASGTVYQALWRGSTELLTCGEDNCIKRWDQRSIRAGCVSAYFGHTSPVKTIALSPDEKFFVSGTINGSVRIWMVDEERMIQDREQNTNKELGLAHKEVRRQQEQRALGMLNSPADMDAHKAILAKEAELEAEAEAWETLHHQKSQLGCTQACFSLDGPTVPMSTLAWREVDGKSWIATGCQDTVVRLFEVDVHSLTGIGR